MRELLQDLGAMRLLLLGVVLVTLPMAAFTDATPEGLGVVSAYIAPAVAVLLVFVLLLDALMNRIFAIDGDDRHRHLTRIRTRADLLALLAILLVWGPYYYALLAP